MPRTQDVMLSFRVPAALVARLDELAAAQGSNRSEVARGVLETFTGGGASDLLDAVLKAVEKGDQRVQQLLARVFREQPDG